MELTKSTEIRHLPENLRLKLAQLLENSWELLMEGIPKDLAENNEGDFVNNIPKYSPDQINLVYRHCMVHKINFPALVLFDEWGCSGKIRPNLGQLVKILSKLQLFRAADYLCILLNEPCPIRPAEGPAAEIPIPSFDEELSTQASTTYGDNRNKDDNNKGYSNQNKVQLPEVQTDTCSDLIRFDKSSSMMENRRIETRTTNQVSEMCSTPILQEEIISKAPIESMIPTFSKLMSDNINNETTNGNISTPFMPDFAGLLDSAPIPNLSAFRISISQDTNYNIETNGYGEIENIQFSDIQLTTDNFSDRRKLGEGGFSTVYLAINLRPAFKQSAVKRLHSNYAKSSEHFFREIELLKNVEHKNLIKLLGYSSHENEMCFIYEYINGGNLYEKLENCRLDKDCLDWKDRVSIALGCSNGIKYLHSSLVNIIHRDIKSSNILLDGLTPKICDFGFIKHANFNTATIAVGTQPYIAPETLRGPVSIAVDIFAFGVVILELVSGFNVLDDSNPNEIIDLVTRFEASLKQSDYHVSFTDTKAGDWIHLNYTKTAAEELLELARKCLLSKSDRIDILEVNLGLTKIHNDYCT